VTPLAASIVRSIKTKPASQISDDMLILADITQKAGTQTFVLVTDVLLKHLPNERAAALGAAVTERRWTHDFPIIVEVTKQLGLRFQCRCRGLCTT
jgi:serine dehydrogenase proteinase